MISEIRLVTLGVADLERSVGFYRDGLGYVEHGRGTIGRELETAWRMPAGLEGRFAVIGAPGTTSGLLRLVELGAPGERIWGDYSRLQDLGHYALNFRVREIAPVWERLLAAGAQPKSKPTFWKVGERIAAWDSQCFDPDGVILDVFELEGDLAATPLGAQTQDVSELQTVAIHCSDMRRSRAFYEGLGFSLLYDKLIEHMAGFFGIPDGTKLHNVNLIKPECSPNGRIELVQYVGYPGQTLRDRAVPPNLGILSASFETEDLGAASDALRGLGAEEIGGPVEVVVPPFGDVSVRTFFGPDGEALELFERR